MRSNTPRIVIAGMGGDTGKTFVSLGLLLFLRQKALSCRAFKKGPDFIDAAWLGWAAQYPAHNLDLYMMDSSAILHSFSQASEGADIALIEGNRGIFDGTETGANSTAELAKLLDAPVILVVNATKMTRTVAALVLGCLTMDPQLAIKGVIVNNIATPRHERVVRDAIESICQLPVVGAIPRLRTDLLPGRHLGLVTPAEHPHIDQIAATLVQTLSNHVDTDQIMGMATTSPPLAIAPDEPLPGAENSGQRPIRVGFICDSAFTFYYPENLEALERQGAQLVAISALSDRSILDSELDALYIGGGFPETHAELLAKNVDFMGSIKLEATKGLPIYAECGGLIYLSKALHYDNKIYPLCGVLPIEVELHLRPQGHGYCEAQVDTSNLIFPVGTKLRGHEFHYSRIIESKQPLPTAYALNRGVGCYDGRDGLLYNGVLASYTHLHAVGCPEWSQGMAAAARIYQKKRKRREG